MLGAPGAGKGTQAKKIAEKYTIPHISTGDIFRANIKNNTELGQKAKTYMDKGELVPDELVVDLIMDRFKEADCANGYVLDGFPRTINCVLKDRRLQRADLHRTASDSSDTKQRYSIEPTFDEKDGEETMAEERSYTPFDGKENDWLSFARQQAEFYRNAGHYITNLQIDIKEIDAEIENILLGTEDAN